MVSTRYRYEVTCAKALFQQLALLITKGYTHWVSGMIPAEKDPREVDAKLLAKYEINVSGKSRVTAKKKGRARLQYLRLGRLFVIAATPDDGYHIFFEYERKSLRSFKTQPFKAWSHSISLRNGHPHVRIPQDAYKFAKRYFTQMATIRSLEWWHKKIQRFPWEPWAPIRRQAFNLIRHVNRLRKAKRLEPIDWRVHYRLKRKPFRVFVEP